MRSCCVILLALVVNGCQGTGEKTASDSASTVILAVDNLRFEVPTDWNTEKPDSDARKAQYELAGPDTSDAASLVVYYFGPGGAGNLQANIDRWVGQFADTDGQPPQEQSRVTARTIDGMQIHSVDVSGRYIAQVTPGSDERYDKPDYRMMAAIIETQDGRYYIKAVGPRRTINQHARAITMFLDSVRHDPTGAIASGAAHP